MDPVVSGFLLFYLVASVCVLLWCVLFGFESKRSDEPEAYEWRQLNDFQIRAIHRGLRRDDR